MASNRFVRLALTTGGTLLWIAALGCGGGSEESAGGESGATSSTPQPMEKGSRYVTLPQKGDEPLIAEVVAGEMSKGFPDDIPTPPESEPRNSLFIPGQGGMATFLSQASRDDIRDYYTKQLPSKGWKVDAPSEEEMRTVISAMKGSRQAKVIIANGPDGSEIMITLEGG